jgi:hypothetical protein
MMIRKQNNLLTMQANKAINTKRLLLERNAKDDGLV